MKRIAGIFMAVLMLCLFLPAGAAAEEHAQPMAVAISVAEAHTLILLENGTVFAAGNNAKGQLDVEDWRDIVQIASSMDHTVGLKADGTLAAAGNNDYGQCDVESWRNIVSIACSSYQTVGVDAEGVVHTAGSKSAALEAVDGLSGVKDIVMTSGGCAALLKDGTVRGFGRRENLDPEEWRDITSISSGSMSLMGFREDGQVLWEGVSDRYLGYLKEEKSVIGYAECDTCVLFLLENGTVTGYGRDRYGMADVSDWTGVTDIAMGYYHSVGLRKDGTVLTASASDRFGACQIPDYLRPSQEALFAAYPRSDKKVIAVEGGGYHTLLLLEDGTVRAFGRNDYGQCDVEDWTDIVAVSGGWGCSVGLRADGTVVAVGENRDGQCNVESWKDITAISAGGDFTLGLDSAGVVHAVGGNRYGQVNIDGLSGVEEICAGYLFSVARMADGTFQTFGANDYDSRVLTGWKNVIRMAAGDFNTLGLHPDGTVIASGRSNNGQINVAALTGVCGIACGTYHCVYLHGDGTVTAMGKNEYGELNTENWKSVIAVSAGYFHTLGLFADGTVLATGGNEYGQCDVPKEFINLGDMASYSPNWHYVWDNYFYGEATDTGWPRGFVVWESTEGSTSYGVNKGGTLNINGWDGTVFSVNRDENGSVSFINVVRMKSGTGIENIAFFADGSCVHIDHTQDPPVRLVRENGVITRQKQSGSRWTTVDSLSPGDPGADGVPYAGFVMTADEQQSGRLHYGSYVIDVTDDAGNSFRLLDLQVDPEGSVTIAYGGHTWHYDVRMNRYTYQE